MGGKKYNKDGSKKPAGQGGAPPGEQSSAKPSTSVERSQQLPAKEPNITKAMQQLAINEPTPPSESKKKQQQQPKGEPGPQQQQQQQHQKKPNKQKQQQQLGGQGQQPAAVNPNVHQMSANTPTKQQQQQQKAPSQPWQQPQPHQSGGPSQGKAHQAWAKPGQPNALANQTKAGPHAIEVERNRTHGPSQHQPSMPMDQLPRSVPRAGSTQSISSSVSSSSGGAGASSTGAIPKASQPQKATAAKSVELPKNLRALRPITKGPGTLGKALGCIEANFLHVDLSKLVDCVYMYDVEIEKIGTGPKKYHLAAFIEFCRLHWPNQRGFGYDWKKIALTARPLNIEGELSSEVQITHPNTGKALTYKVTIKPAGEGADGAMVPIKQALANYTREAGNMEETLQALDIIFKSAYNQHLDRGIRGGRSFYFIDRRGPRLPNLRDFYELRQGIFQSLTLGHAAQNRKIISPMLNVDVTNKAFPRPYNSLIQLLQDMEREYSTPYQAFPPVKLDQPLDDEVARRLHNHLSGLDLMYCSDGKNKTVKRYLELGRVPDEETFEKDGKKVKMTVSKYFRDVLKRKIHYEKLQCIRMGHRDRYISAPMEYCSIIIQVVNKKCTEQQTAAMIKYTAVSTDQRKANIQQQVNSIQYNRSENLAAFGIRVDDSKFVQVPARQLQPPNIVYSNGAVTPSKGQWRMDFGKMNKTFLNAAKCLKWCVLNTDQRLQSQKLDNFVTELYNVSQINGIQMDRRPIKVKYQCKPHELGQWLNRMAGQKVDIVFCAVPSRGPNYGKIKQQAELVTGVLTQCIKTDTIVKRCDRMTLGNLLLKVNAKLNGTNHQLAAQMSPILNKFDREPVMFIGADVTHPAAGTANGYSVAAAVASHDRNAFCYNTGWRVQTGEIIADFQTFVTEALQFFVKENGKLPSKIFYFRDGVSDSQFKHVMEFEWDAMLKACAAMKPGYEKKVNVTIIIVQKRHRTRFFPGKSGISEDKNNNVPAGTVVDTIITRPDEAQYYLCSHQAIQGVSRPTKYCILLDDGNHTMDELQALTYNLCHMFARCNRSVSYPAPTYYAHLAAERGKVLCGDRQVDVKHLDEFVQPVVRISATYPMYFI